MDKTITLYILNTATIKRRKHIFVKTVGGVYFSYLKLDINFILHMIISRFGEWNHVILHCVMHNLPACIRATGEFPPCCKMSESCCSSSGWNKCIQLQLLLKHHILSNYTKRISKIQMKKLLNTYQVILGRFFKESLCTLQFIFVW